MAHIETLKLALEALKKQVSMAGGWQSPAEARAITAMSQAIEHAEQAQPVAKYLGESHEGSLVQLYEDVKKGTEFYTAPPPHQHWVGLTDQEFQWIYGNGRTPAGMIEMAEAKLKEKNGY